MGSRRRRSRDASAAVSDAFQGSGSEWAWCSTHREMDSPGMKIVSSMHALNLGNDGEDGQPDDLQLRENVIAVAATQSSTLSIVWSWEAAKSRWSIRMQTP